MNHEKISYFYLLLSFYIICFKQAPDFKWVKHYTGTETRSISIVQDGQGNLLNVGSFYDSTQSVGSSSSNALISNGSSDIFIRKLDGAGNILWTKQIGGIDFDDASALSLDSLDNIYISGRYSGTVDFNPNAGTSTLTSNGNFNQFILKLNQQGNFIWVKSFENTFNIYSLKADLLGNILVAGSFLGTLDFDPNAGVTNVTSYGFRDAFILKLNNDGNFIWAKNLGSIYDDEAYDLVCDSFGNVYSTGIFQGVGDFDPNAGVYNLTSSATTTANVFVSKLDSNGNFVWAKSFFSQNFNISSSIAIDHNGAILTTGYYLATVDCDPGVGSFSLTSNGGTECFISKLANDGSFIWAKSLGSSLNDYGMKICINSQNDVYLAGEFDNVVDFDPGPNTYNLTSLGNLDAFVLKLTSAGNFEWAQKFSGTMSEIILYMTVNDNGNVFTTGIFQATTDFDPSNNVNTLTATLNNTNSNSFVHKLGFCEASTDTINQGTCNAYTINGQTYSQPGQYIQSFQNSIGCDSFLVINLSLDTSNSSIAAAGCDSIMVNNVTYYTSGTYTQLFTNVSGCDSIVFVQANVSHSTSNIFSVTACDSFTLNNQVYFTSGTYTQQLINSIGCDSVITLNLTVLQNATTNQTIYPIACNTFTLNGISYNNSGTYVQTLTNSVGCDSILTIQLTINQSTNSSTQQSACNSYTWNGQTYISSGNYSQIYTNTNGCDSTANLNVTINTLISNATSNGNILNASPSNATYQWIDCTEFFMIQNATSQTYTATTNGSYAVIVTQNGCTDTSNCVIVSNVGIEEIEMVNYAISPNPSSKSLTISSTKEFTNAMVKLFNMTGQLLLKVDEVKGKEIQLDVSSFANGVYFVEIMQDGKIERMKVLKE